MIIIGAIASTSTTATAPPSCARPSLSSARIPSTTPATTAATVVSGWCATAGRSARPPTASQRRALLTHLADLRCDGVRYGDVAVLVPTNTAAGGWVRGPRDAGLPAMLLAD